MRTKQIVERYVVSEESSMVERICERIKQGYKVVNMVSTKEMKDVGMLLPIVKDIVIVVYEREQ